MIQDRNFVLQEDKGVCFIYIPLVHRCKVDLDQAFQRFGWTVQFIAEGACQLSGFDVAAISIVHDGNLHLAAVAGSDEARAELSQVVTPVDAMMRELENGRAPVSTLGHESQTSQARL